jgi:Cu2+-exporting ATPase
MKTSVIEVRDMLSVLSVDGVEKRIGEVPGVESVTVNFAAKNATVRYDETRLEVGDIKSDVRQRGQDSAQEPSPEQESHETPASFIVGRSGALTSLQDRFCQPQTF